MLYIYMPMLHVPSRELFSRDSSLAPHQHVSSPAALIARRRYAHLVEAPFHHFVDLAHEDVGRHLILGAPEFSARREQSEVSEGLDRQGQAQRPRLRAGFGSRHRYRNLGL